MIVKKNKKKLNAIESFPNLESFINHLLIVDSNLRFENDSIVSEYQRLYDKLINGEGELYYSYIIHWLRKNYGFKTKKWANVEYFTERGWSIENALCELNKRNKEIKQRNRLCEEYWINKGFSKEEAINEISLAQKNSSKCVKIYHGKSKKMLIEKGYSEEQIKNICLSPTNIEFWVSKGLTIGEANIKISELQTNNANKFSNLRKDNPNDYSAISQTQLGYWVNKGYSNYDAKIEVSKRQTTFSKELCIQKYGEEEGLKIFTERQNKWSKSLSTGGNLKIGYSKISQELFYCLLDKYEIRDKDSIYFATHNKEFKLNKCESEGGIWLYDFTDIKNKKIIEFHGDMYHGNPKKYKSTDYPHPFRKSITAQEMWYKDKRKLETAIEEGFELLVVWDSEYRWGNKQEIIDKCIQFLKNNKNG